MEFMRRRFKFVAMLIVFCFTLLIMYFGISVYFTNHLYFGSKINGTDVSGKTVDQIKTELSTQLNTYSLSLVERDGKKENIKAKDIDLKYSLDKQLYAFKAEQNPLNWALSIFNSQNSMKITMSYDKEHLKELVNNLACVTDKNAIKPQNPSFKFNNSKFEIVGAVNGTEINKDVLLSSIEKALNSGESTIDLVKMNCYVKPQYTSKSQKVVDAKNALNKAVAAKITYTFGDKNEVLDSKNISSWLSVDNDYNIVVDEGKVKNYVDTLAANYDTVGKTRSFHTTAGNTININGGDYGWQIDIDKEVKALIDNIKNGQLITKEPIYSEKTASRDNNDIGNTYVEINLSAQHLWFYKNGSLVVDGNVVTGNESINDGTPSGVYSVKDKERNAVLKGPGYAAPVNYWMPFNGGIGMHDASWRSVFGGEIYETNGSHGCVNCPYNLAQALYNNIDVGTPVVCYY